MKQIVWLFAGFLLLILGCRTRDVGVEFTCDVLLEPALVKLDLTTLSPEKIANWITHTYAIKPEELRFDTYTEGRYGISYTSGVRWETYDRTYYGDFLDEELQRVMVLWDKDKDPSIQSVLNCLGPPEYYSALYRHSAPEDLLDIRLYYTEKGILVWIEEFSVSSDPPLVETSDAISRIAVTLPGSSTEINQTADALLLPENRQWLSDITKPWPGSWSDIEIVVDLTYKPLTP